MEEGEVDGESRGGDQDVLQNRSTLVQLATDDSLNSELNISPKAEHVTSGPIDSSCAGTVISKGFSIVTCPDCHIELNPLVHKFCYVCGKKVDEIISSMGQYKDLSIVTCPDCHIELNSSEHKFCYVCGKKVEEIVSSMEQHKDISSRSQLPSLCPPEPQLNKVFVTAGEVEGSRQQVVQCEVMIEDQITEDLEQSAPAIPSATKLIAEIRPLSNTATECKEDENKEMGKENIDAKTKEERGQDSLIKPTYPHVTCLRSTANEAEDLNTQNNADSKETAGESKNVCGIREAFSEGSVSDDILSDGQVQSKHKKSFDETKKLGLQTLSETDQNVSNTTNQPEMDRDAELKTDKRFCENNAEVDQNDSKTLEHDEQMVPVSDKKSQCVTDPPDHQTQANTAENKFAQKKSEVYRACTQVSEKTPAEEEKGEGEKQASTSSKAVDEEKPGENLENVQSRSETAEFQQRRLDGTKKNSDGTSRLSGDIVRNGTQSSDDEVMKKNYPDLAKINKPIPTLLQLSKQKCQLPNKEVISKPSESSILKSGKEDGKSNDNKESPPPFLSQDNLPESNLPRIGDGKQDDGKPTSDNGKEKDILKDQLSKENDHQPPGRYYRKEDSDENYMDARPIELRSNTRSNQNSTQTTGTHQGSTGSEKYLTVVFHAILSAKFKPDKDTHVFIQGERPIFWGWKKNTIELTQEKQINDNVLLCGRIIVPLTHCHIQVPYKYVVQLKGVMYYERLIEFYGTDVNRCFEIPREVVKNNATWHKYDGFVYPHPGGLFGSVFTWGYQIDDRRKALEILFPSWRGFYVAQHDCDLSLVNALQQLKDLVNSISSLHTMWGKNVTIYKIPSYDLNLCQVIQDFLAKKIDSNLNVLSGKITNAERQIASAILSAVIIIHVYSRHGVRPTDKLLESLLKCLKLPPNQHVCSAFMDEIKEFGEHIQAVRESLCKFFYQSNLPKCHPVDWLQALPLLHFVRGNSSPFMDLKSGKNISYENWKWWGLEGMNVRVIRRCIMDSTIDLIGMLPGLTSLFDMDRLLHRSYLLLSPVDIYGDFLRNTGPFSILDVCTTLAKNLILKLPSSYTKQFMNYLLSLFGEVKRIMSDTSNVSMNPKNKVESELLLQTFQKLLVNIIEKVELRYINVLCRVVECMISQVQRHYNGMEHEDFSCGTEDHRNSEEGMQLETIPVQLASFVKEATGVVNRFFKDKRTRSLETCGVADVNVELQAWNELLSVDAPEVFHKLWHDVFIKQMKERINKVSTIRAIEIFCQSDEQNYHSKVTVCLSDAAFKAVDEMVKPGKKQHMEAIHYLRDSDSKKCVGLINRMLKKSWLLENIPEKSENVLLIHFLTSPTWPGFLKFFGGHSTKKFILSEDAQEIMSTAETSVQNLVDTVQNGSITVAIFEILEQYSAQFVTLGKICQENRNLTKTNEQTPIAESFAHRTQEIKEFKNHRERLNSLIGICDSFVSVDEKMGILRERIKEDISERPIRELCVRTAAGMTVVFFDLEQEVHDMVSKIHDLQTSRIFSKLWETYCNQLQGVTVTIEAVFQSIWTPVCQRLASIKEQFLNGEMQLKEVEEYLDMFNKKYEKLEREFELLLNNSTEPKTRLDIQKDQLYTRMDQIKEYVMLSTTCASARSILKVKEAMKLTGDFSEVESIDKIGGGSFSNKSINSVSEELLQTGRKLLNEITEERAVCLTTFSKCSALVEWMKENMTGPQELKVFVDLAMISAGESDQEIDRISFMHTSCLGFGSLIFGLETDHGFQQLMDLCQPVWQAVQANRNLPDQLESTNQHMSWLKQVKESLGSVAVTTGMQVKAINSSGVYHIADFELLKSTKNGNLNNVKSEGVCLESLICLVVPKDDEKKREEKIYSFEEVKDVQSKLMLIAGKTDKGKEELVDPFLQVFEGVLQVGSLYVELCEVGEINYLTWKIAFQCSEEKRDNVLEDIKQTCVEMEQHLKTWKSHIDENRKDCYTLNHFTMKQILKLRKELASACTGQVPIDQLSLQSFTLLESACKHVEPVMLGNVLETIIPKSAHFISKESSKDEHYFKVENNPSETLDDEVDFQPVVDISPRRRKRKSSLESFISAKENLEAESFSEHVIIASLAACGRGATEDELVMWAVSTGSGLDDAALENMCEDAFKNPELTDLLEDFKDESDNNEVKDGEHLRLDMLPTKKPDLFTEKRVSNPLKTYVKNKEDTYLTLPALAAIVEELNKSELLISPRKFPTNLKGDEPNLLLVPKGDIYASILTLFVGDRDQRLPTDEEVVVCNKKTTAEEIELLWRRAVANKSGLIFCLANADLLDYDVSQRAVRALEHLTQGKSSYRLVVICSIENENKSNMIASLDQFRRPFLPITSVRNIQDYLRRQLAARTETQTIGQVHWLPAATVDKDGLSVRVVQSSRAGVGKSLIVKRLAKKLENLQNNKRLRPGLVSSLCQTIPVHGLSADSSKLTRALSAHAVKADIPVSRIFHIDISQTVNKGLDNLLFKLLILGTIKDSGDNVWRRKSTDMYVIEVTTDESFFKLISEETFPHGHIAQLNTRKTQSSSKYSLLKFLPRTHCLTPRETLSKMQRNQRGDTQFDTETFHSVEYQRTFQYLKLFDEQQSLPDNFIFQHKRERIKRDPTEALKITMKYCGIRDPSWSELHHFVNFLNVQLSDCEESVFCDAALVGDILQGFRTFVVRFLIQMSRDFATRSLSDRNLTINESQMAGDEEDDLVPFKIRRRWEESPHPYIFFNQDHQSLTFLGFLISNDGNLLNPENGNVLEQRLMDPTLRGQLKAQGVEFDNNYETWDRSTRITNLCRVMGIDFISDPDPTYELTTDNVEKILAIHMRFRCGIPVIIMGETGCGKTRLIKFMCELQSGPDGPRNMLLMKVHGGTSYKDIEEKVKEAEQLAVINEQINTDTVLFFDEANTTDAIDLVKEIMVDRRVNGRPLNPAASSLQFIVACNPYRKHTIEMIDKLESAGLGYHVSADKTEDKLGSIPLRQLVYRVHPLPESMRPLVWDFGQLTDHTEELYTRQIVRRYFITPTPRVEQPVESPYRSIPRFKQKITTPNQKGIPVTELQRTAFLSESKKYKRKHKVRRVLPSSTLCNPSTSHEVKETVKFSARRSIQRLEEVEQPVESPSRSIARLKQIHSAWPSSTPRPSTSREDEDAFPSTLSGSPSADEHTTIANKKGIHGTESQATCIANILSASQKYMRKQNDECSFVSLRDVERAMKVITWFYGNSELISKSITEAEITQSSESSGDKQTSKTEDEMEKPLTTIVRALVLGIGVCYYARLYNRDSYCEFIAPYFTGPCSLPGGDKRMVKEITSCKRAFLYNIELGKNIARNAALSENVFMMAVCTELRIPLFVVGKPGSSKSLAKDVISTHMKGDDSKNDLLKNLKQIHMQSYQCSPLSTPEGIVSMFKQCSILQKDKNLEKFVSVVVLDEIGLAEDSPLMPLKTLHPLLEDGTATENDSSREPLGHLRVGFIGLSNWALDPAKMNRGIMLCRGVPTVKELIDSANGICSSDEHVQRRLAPIIRKLANGYYELYCKQKQSKTLKKAKKDEFFGLRDFYSLVKMVHGFASETNNEQINSLGLEQAIRRNFSGLDDFNPLEIFANNEFFPSLKNYVQYPSPEGHPVKLIHQNLKRTNAKGESRYLLVLTENYSALRILQQEFFKGTDHDPVVIFGSSFPKDQHYTQICRNINEIKVCMETGRTVILLNLESLYESLYDALNQYYSYFGQQKYVDLGLGNHRVKCRVADNFKLIVIAEKDVVYERFPIPLINRLEKHFLVMSTSLTAHQAELVKELEEWILCFSKAKLEYSEEQSSIFKPGDSFVGYHSDTAASIIMKVSKDQPTDKEILEESKYTLLRCASPDAIARLPTTQLKHHAKKLWKMYFGHLNQSSLLDYLVHSLGRTQPGEDEGFLVQISTHSRLLSKSNAKAVAKAVRFPGSQFLCINLQEFHTKQQFTKTISDFFIQLGGSEGLLLVQCDDGESNFNLIACSRYLLVDTRRQTLEDVTGPKGAIHIIVVIQLPKIAEGCQNFVGFQGGGWRSVHIDELSEPSEQLPRIVQLVNRSVTEILKPLEGTTADDVEFMDIDDDSEENDENTGSTGDLFLKRFDPTLILRNCLQVSVARVYDDSMNVDRATKRIEILLDLWTGEESNDTGFPDALVRRVHQLLQQRDEECWQDQARLWLRNEALCRTRLQETGTFRKALWQRLSSIVSPMLAEVIAFCDRNQNLNLVQGGKNDWKSNFWLTMLNEQQVTPLDYKSFTSPISHTVRERACIVSSGAGHQFQGQFPFSWAIRDMVNVLLIQVEANHSKSTILSSLRSVIDSTPLGSLLTRLFEDSSVKESAVMDYLHDFLHMVYKPMVEDEMKFVSDCLIAAARGIHNLLYPNDSFTLDIALIHFSYFLIQSRLSFFSDLVQACPSIVKKLMEHRVQLNVNEMILDVVTLECCLEELVLKRQQLMHSEQRLIWCNKIQIVRPTIQVMTRVFPERLQQRSLDDLQLDSQVVSIGTGSIRIMNHCRLSWIRLGVVRLFIEHTCLPDVSPHPEDAQNAFQLWKAIGENPDFSSVETIAIIERFLKECSERVNKRYSSQSVELYNNFRNRFKSFFMELVALYCFGDESRQLPKPELVIKFIGYVIREDHKTEDFTPFDDQAIDTTPVVRSFILQQLLVHKDKFGVPEHLQEYLSRARSLATQRNHTVEVCVLCVQCMEDIETSTLLRCKETAENSQILLATRNLQNALQVFSSDMRTPPNVFNVNSLQTVASTRASLDVLSTYIGEATDRQTPDNLQELVQVARNLCNVGSPIRLFLLKQLVRKFGIDIVKEICQTRGLEWIFPEQSQQEERIPDSFIVHRENYHKIREALAKAILTCSTDELYLTLQNIRTAPSARDCYILLSLFREVTTFYRIGNNQDKSSAMVFEKIHQFIVETEHLSKELKPLADEILNNTLNKNVNMSRINVEQAGNQRRLEEVLVHFKIVLECLPRNHLLQPLRNLAVNPTSMTRAFLPTMPHDYASEAMKINIGRWYECPNGHRYVITECGNPQMQYTCPDCKAPIGGLGELAAKNRDASGDDRSNTGHIIGPAQTRPPSCTSERDLTPLACGVLRFLTHAAMLLGTDRNMPHVISIVKPPVVNVIDFLLAHLQHDIGCLARSSGKNENEAIQIIHLVLTGIINQQLQKQPADNLNVDATLPNIHSRIAWENGFVSTYLNPILSNLSELLQDSVGRMIRDERLGNDPLMRQLYELDSPNYDVMENLNPMCAALWRYRTKVSVEHLNVKFLEFVERQDKSNRCEILGEFLKKEPLLRALQYLPNILKLQRHLSEKFHRRLDRNEAETFTLGEYIKRAPQLKKQLKELVDCFRKAWKLIRSSLSQNGRLSIPKDLCMLEVKNNTPIYMFLPANSGHGRCALSLTSFLVTLHNEFIGRCKTLLKDESSSPEVPLVNITKAHLVAYDLEKDLQPMILAHCDYSLKVGQGTIVEYNWMALERQLIDRFISGRNRITTMVKPFVFSKDVCDGEVFAALKQKIHQIELSRSVQDQVLNELNQLTDICDVLKSLQIAIGFLASASGHPSMLISDYLHTALKMANKDGLKSSKAEQFCQIQHIISLWRLLSLERAMLLIKHKQDPFDDISVNVKKKLSNDQKFELGVGLQKLNIDHFVKELLECVLLYLKHVPKEQLHWPLSDYINAKLEEKNCDAIENLHNYLQQDILLEHAVETWKFACQKSEDYHERIQE